jgi:hypothetical protein
MVLVFQVRDQAAVHSGLDRPLGAVDRVGRFREVTLTDNYVPPSEFSRPSKLATNSSQMLSKMH